MANSDYVDGFLEGHEAPGLRTLYRLFIVAFLILSAFAGIANFCLIGKPGFRASDAVLSTSILGLVVVCLQHIKWYRQDNQDPKHKKLTAVFILFIILLDVAACLAFHETLKFEVPPPCPIPEPCPTTLPPSTPAPNTTIF